MSNNVRGAQMLSAVALLAVTGTSLTAIITLLAGGTSALANFWFATANQLAAATAAITAITAAALLVRSQLRPAGLLAAATAAMLIALGGLRVVVLAQVLESIDPRQQAESVSGITYSAIGAGAGLILLPVAFGIAALIASRLTGNRISSRAAKPTRQTAQAVSS